MKWLQTFFKKKIRLPLWFLILGRPVGYDNFEEYSETLSAISNGLMDGKTVIIKVNDVPTIIWSENGQIKMRALEKSEWTLDL